MTGALAAIVGASGVFVTGGTASVSGVGPVAAPGTSVANTGTASIGTVYNAVPTATYLWEHVSGDTATVNNPTSSSTTFTRSVSVLPGEFFTRSGIYRCKVTDGAGQVAYGPMCVVNTNHYDNT